MINFKKVFNFLKAKKNIKKKKKKTIYVQKKKKF